MDHDDIEYLTRTEALDFAQSHASRDVAESASNISFVGCNDLFFDHCLYELTEERPNGWQVTFRSLADDERKPDEVIDDGRIKQLALSGNRTGAIGLYRCKYKTGLAEARAAVASMQQT